MARSQKKPLQNKSKRKLEENVVDENTEIAEKMLKTKKPKISKEVKHVSETEQQGTNVSRKRKINKQGAPEKVIKIINKTVKTKETLVSKVDEKKSSKHVEKKSMKQNEEKCIKLDKKKFMKLDEEKCMKLHEEKPAKLNEKNDEAEDFAEKLSKSHIQQCISAMFHLTEQQLKGKINLLAEEAQPIFMQVTCIRIPRVPRRQMRILLPHSIVTPDDEVALFVCDLERGRRKDYEPTVEHYKNVLTEHKCTRVNEIIPMNRVKTEFDQFELKRKLAASYDYFLVDSRIAGHMCHLLGKEFSTRRKLPTSVRMNSKDLKHEIDYALRKTSMQLHSDGDSHVVQVGNTLMKENEILENILTTCENLSKNYPGGSANIRSLRLKGATTLGLPFYMTLKDKNKVIPPVVHPKRPKAYQDVKGDLSTFVKDTDVTVKPDGDVIVHRITRNKDKKKISKK